MARKLFKYGTDILLEPFILLLKKYVITYEIPKERKLYVRIRSELFL